MSQREPPPSHGSFSPTQSSYSQNPPPAVHIQAPQLGQISYPSQEPMQQSHAQAYSPSSQRSYQYGHQASNHGQLSPNPLQSPTLHTPVGNYVPSSPVYAGPHSQQPHGQPPSHQTSQGYQSSTTPSPFVSLSPGPYQSFVPAPFDSITPSHGYALHLPNPSLRIEMVDRLYDAIHKNTGTSRKLELAKLGPQQMADLRAAYETIEPKKPSRTIENPRGTIPPKQPSVKDLDRVASSFGVALVSLALGPLGQDVENLYNSIRGGGTTERLIDDVLVCRTNADVKVIKTAYNNMKNQGLMDHLLQDLSGTTKRMYRTIFQAHRVEDCSPLNPALIPDYVDKLYNSGDEENHDDFFETLLPRNNAEVCAIVETFYPRKATTLIEFIKKKFSGHEEGALKLFVRRALNRAKAGAELLEKTMSTPLDAATRYLAEKTMKATGTKPPTGCTLLINRVIRVHWDSHYLSNVVHEYNSMYKKSLEKSIVDSAPGGLEKILLACVRP